MMIGEKIHYLRNIKQISQEELATHIGVSRQAISKWEMSQSIPDLENLRVLADFFQVKLSYLLDEEDVESVSYDHSKANRLLKTSRILFLASITLTIWYFFLMVISIFFQKTGTNDFIFPKAPFIFNSIMCIVILLFNILLWKETKKKVKGIRIEVLFLILSVVIYIVIPLISNAVESQMISNLDISMVSSYMIVRGKLNFVSTSFFISLILFLTGDILLMSVKYVFKQSYVIGLSTKKYDFGYGFLAFILAIFSWVSLVIMAYWLYELKQTNSQNYHYMKKPFLIGAFLQGIILVGSLILCFS